MLKQPFSIFISELRYCNPTLKFGSIFFNLHIQVIFENKYTIRNKTFLPRTKYAVKH